MWYVHGLPYKPSIKVGEVEGWGFVVGKVKPLWLQVSISIASAKHLHDDNNDGSFNQLFMSLSESAVL